MFNPSHADRTAQQHLRFSLPLLGFSVMLFALSLLVLPVAVTYVGIAMLIGIAYTGLVLLFWRYKQPYISMIYVLLIVSGHFTTATLFDRDDGSLVMRLAALFQYLSIVFAIYFAILTALRSRIQAYLRNTRHE